MDRVAAVATGAHILGWAVYIGGAVAMELIWRPAQRDMPPSLVGVICQRMGKRYRWIALGSLAAIGVSGAARLAAAGHLSASPPVFRDPLTLSTSYGRTMLAAVACWTALVFVVLTMSFAAHPALHVRTSADMTPEERHEARQLVARTIKRMDLLLRTELGLVFVAALLGASLRSGGLL